MRHLIGFLFAALLTLSVAHADAGPDADTIGLFKNAGASAQFFGNCYGYAVFPSVGQGALVVGGAYGTGRVYEHDNYVGDVSMTQLSIGLQLGGQVKGPLKAA